MYLFVGVLNWIYRSVLGLVPKYILKLFKKKSFHTTSGDVDNVLFLVGIEVNVNSRIQDGTHRTPLHLAVPTGNEIIVRHLLLAGADVNAVDKNRQAPLHVAAIEDRSTILEVCVKWCFLILKRR